MAVDTAAACASNAGLFMGVTEFIVVLTEPGAVIVTADRPVPPVLAVVPTEAEGGKDTERDGCGEGLDSDEADASASKADPGCTIG